MELWILICRLSRMRWLDEDPWCVICYLILVSGCTKFSTFSGHWFNCQKGSEAGNVLSRSPRPSGWLLDLEQNFLDYQLGHPLMISYRKVSRMWAVAMVASVRRVRSSIQRLSESWRFDLDLKVVFLLLNDSFISVILRKVFNVYFLQIHQKDFERC